MKLKIENKLHERTHATIVLFVAFLLFSIVNFFFHYKFISSFSFVDEYTHYVAGYYMTRGNILYKDIFFQHQMLPVYFSFLIQIVLHPDTLYKLVLEHRLFVFMFSFLIDLLLVLRFRFVGLGFVIVYELTKYYLFGNLFLGETFIAPVFAYELGLFWEKNSFGKLRMFDIISTGLATWFILFTREPYIPCAIFLYLLILWGKREYSLKFISLSLCALLSFVTLATVSLPAYFTDILKINFSGYAQAEVASNNLAGIGILKIFLYPLFIFISGKWNEFRLILIFIDVAFFALSGLYVRRYLAKIKSLGKFIMLIGILGLCAIRWSEPGSIFYSGFHFLPWYALFIMAVFLLWTELVNQFSKVIVYFLMIAGILGISFAYPHSYLTQKVDKITLFNTNYSRFYTYGTVAKTLASSGNTLFVDQWDSLIYWQAKMFSSYPYVFYYPVMTSLAEFRQARTRMFASHPPDFYYIDCPKNVTSVVFAPKSVIDSYVQIYYAQKPVCFYIKKDVAIKISTEKWEAIEELGFSK